MTLQECYEALGGDYEDVLGRLRSEQLVKKFVLKFLDDGSYNSLYVSFDQKDYSEAFRAAHTIKGMCQNLSFTKLQESSSLLTEALRDGYTPEADSLMEQVTEDYQQAIDAIHSFQGEIEE